MNDNELNVITSILELRQRVYDTYTLKLLETYTPIFNNVAAIYFKTAADFKWIDVQQNTYTDKIIMLIGKASLKEGDSFLANGELQNITQFTEIMVSIPLLISSIHQGDAQFISDQTSFIQLLSNTFEVSEITEIINSPEFMDSKSFYTNTFFEKYLNRLTRPKNVGGFDTSKLTDDQIHNMFLYADLNKMVN